MNIVLLRFRVNLTLYFLLYLVLIYLFSSSVNSSDPLGPYFPV